MITNKESLIGNISGKEQMTGSLNNGIEEIYPELENLEVTPSINQQIFNHSNSYGYDEVVVNAIDINLQDKTVTPTNSQQIISADEGYTALNEVTVEAAAIVQTGTLSPASTGSNETITVNGTLSNLVIYESTASETVVGARFVAGIFINGTYKYGLRTNAAGTSYGVLNSKNVTFSTNQITIVTDTMSRLCAGYTYTWFAW